MRERVIALVGLVLLTILMVTSFLGLPWNPEAQDIPNEGVAQALFDTYSFSLIVIGLLLAVAMIGGIYLARKEEP